MSCPQRDLPGQMKVVTACDSSYCTRGAVQVSGELVWRAGRDDLAAPPRCSLRDVYYMPDVLFGIASHRAGR